MHVGGALTRSGLLTRGVGETVHEVGRFRPGEHIRSWRAVRADSLLQRQVRQAARAGKGSSRGLRGWDSVAVAHELRDILSCSCGHVQLLPSGSEKERTVERAEDRRPDRGRAANRSSGRFGRASSRGIRIASRRTAGGAGMKILVVDDSRRMRKLIRRALEDVGYSAEGIIEASDGVEAIDRLREHRLSIDVILADWNMPNVVSGGVGAWCTALCLKSRRKARTFRRSRRGMIPRRKRDAHLQRKRSEGRAIGSTFATPGKDNREWSRKAGPTALNKDAQGSQDRTFPSCLPLFVSLSSGAEEAGDCTAGRALMGKGKEMAEEERTLQVDANGFHLGQDGIAYVTAIGEKDGQAAAEIREIALRVMATVEGKVHILVDLNRAGKQSPQARKIWQELSEHDKIGKVALYGLHPVARVLASFVIGVTRKKEMRFFKTKEEALAWIRE